MKSSPMETHKAKRLVGDQKVPFLRTFQYADGTDMVLMLVGTAAALANGALRPLWTVIFGQAIDALGGTTSDVVLTHRINQAVLNFVYLAMGAAIVSFLQVSCWTITGERQVTRIRSLYLKSVLRQDISFFDIEMVTTGHAVSRISVDTALIQCAIGDKVGSFLQLLATFVGAFVVALTKGWLLTVIMLSTLPIIVLAGAATSYIFSTVSTKGQAAYRDAGDLVESTIASITTVVSFNGENKAIAQYNKLLKQAYKAAVNEALASGFGMGAIYGAYLSSYGLAFWYGGRLIRSNGYTGAQVINVLLSIMTGAMSLGNATPCFAAFAQGQSAAYRLFMTIDRKPPIDSEDKSGTVLQQIRGDVELRDIYFSYPARPEQKIFDGFSLHVPGGTTMAIVGESGSGKSTVISLLQRYYDPQGGGVYIDGVNLKSFQLQWIRGKIGLVSQEPMLFMTSIMDNIAYGKEDATIEEIKRAAELSHATTFIEELPNGYNTVIGQRGAQLSGGQKQRIAIARAILRDPKILLFDEATSALDLESERLVQQALRRVMLDRTTIVVAHRLATVMDANCISVVNRGRIVDQGTHSELLTNPDGAFSQLYRIQQNQEQDRTLEKSKPSPFPSNSIADSSSISSSRGVLALGTSSLPSSAEWLLGSSTTDGDGHCKENGDDDTYKAHQTAGPIARIAFLQKPEALVLFFGSLAAGIHGTLFPLFGLVISNAIKTFYEPLDKLEKDAGYWASMCLLLATVSIILVPIEYYLLGVAGGKLTERIRALSFKSIMQQEVAWFDDPSNSSGALGARLSVDAMNVQRLVGDNLALTVQTASTLIAGVLIATIADWKLSLIIMCAIPLVVLQGYVQMKSLIGFSQDAKMVYEDASLVASDAVSSIRTVSSFCAEKRVMRIYDNKCEWSMKQGIRVGMIRGLGFGFSFLVIYLTYGLCFYVGGQFVSQGKSTFAGVFKVFFALLYASIGASHTCSLASDSSQAKISATSILTLLDRKSKINSSSAKGWTLQQAGACSIDFRNVSFKYPARPDVQVLSDFSLHIPSGKTIALVGQSGSGKSTVIALLQRFYDPDSGAILLDGVDLSSLNVSWLRGQMALVGQEPVLFNGTIRANIAYGSSRGVVTDDELVACAKAANAHDFISSLPDGYETAVGERGVQLSGGQKQRVAIARALVKNPRILLLDEATSALDAESERVVQATLDRVMAGKTTIIVAHRLSTIRAADIIAVVKDGIVVETGPQHLLIEKQCNSP